MVCPLCWNPDHDWGMKASEGSQAPAANGLKPQPPGSRSLWPRSGGSPDDLKVAWSPLTSLQAHWQSGYVTSLVPVLHFRRAFWFCRTCCD